jgi:hypothetical protein
MHEFTQLLLSASKTRGNLLHVARLLQVEPKLVYRWIADFERPAEARLDELKQRLRSIKTAPSFGPRPRRRAHDPRLSTI